MLCIYRGIYTVLLQHVYTESLDLNHHCKSKVEFVSTQVVMSHAFISFYTFSFILILLNIKAGGHQISDMDMLITKLTVSYDITKYKYIHKYKII